MRRAEGKGRMGCAGVEHTCWGEAMVGGVRWTQRAVKRCGGEENEAVNYSGAEAKQLSATTASPRQRRGGASLKNCLAGVFLQKDREIGISSSYWERNVRGFMKQSRVLSIVHSGTSWSEGWFSVTTRWYSRNKRDARPVLNGTDRVDWTAANSRRRGPTGWAPEIFTNIARRFYTRINVLAETENLIMSSCWFNIILGKTLNAKLQLIHTLTVFIWGAKSRQHLSKWIPGLFAAQSGYHLLGHLIITIWALQIKPKWPPLIVSA